MSITDANHVRKGIIKILLEIKPAQNALLDNTVPLKDQNSVQTVLLEHTAPPGLVLAQIVLLGNITIPREQLHAKPVLLVCIVTLMEQVPVQTVAKELTTTPQDQPPVQTVPPDNITTPRDQLPAQNVVKEHTTPPRDQLPAQSVLLVSITTPRDQPPVQTVLPDNLATPMDQLLARLVVRERQVAQEQVHAQIVALEQAVVAVLETDRMPTVLVDVCNAPAPHTVQMHCVVRGANGYKVRVEFLLTATETEMLPAPTIDALFGSVVAVLTIKAATNVTMVPTHHGLV